MDSASDAETDSTSDTTADGWSDLLGSDWRGSEASESSEDSIFTSDSDSDSGDADDEMPELLAAGFPDSDDEEEEESTKSSATSESSSGRSAAEWDWDNVPMDIDGGPAPPSNNPLRWVRSTLAEMHAQWYEMPRDTFPRGPAFMHHVLTEMKDTRSDLFRQELRIHQEKNSFTNLGVICLVAEILG
jgi:hypothetical protein